MRHGNSFFDLNYFFIGRNRFFVIYSCTGQLNLKQEKWKEGMGCLRSLRLIKNKMKSDLILMTFSENTVNVPMNQRDLDLMNFAKIISQDQRPKNLDHKAFPKESLRHNCNAFTNQQRAYAATFFPFLFPTMITPDISPSKPLRSAKTCCLTSEEKCRCISKRKWPVGRELLTDWLLTVHQLGSLKAKMSTVPLTLCGNQLFDTRC